jgi:hypothetical protein
VPAGIESSFATLDFFDESTLVVVDVFRLNDPVEVDPSLRPSPDPPGCVEVTDHRQRDLPLASVILLNMDLDELPGGPPNRSLREQAAVAESPHERRTILNVEPELLSSFSFIRRRSPQDLRRPICPW